MEKYTPYIIPVLLVAWILYRRVSQAIGFQKYSPNSLVMRIVIFSLIALFLLAFAVFNPMSLLYDSVGTLLGVGLVYFAVRHSVFEKRPKGLYYRTHIWVELTVLILFFARFLYRFYLMYGANGGPSSQAPQDIANQMKNRDPLTGALFFILCAYYIGYCSYIYRTGRLKLLEPDVNAVAANIPLP